MQSASTAEAVMSPRYASKEFSNGRSGSSAAYEDPALRRMSRSWSQSSVQRSRVRDACSGVVRRLGETVLVVVRFRVFSRVFGVLLKSILGFRNDTTPAGFVHARVDSF